MKWKLFLQFKKQQITIVQFQLLKFSHLMNSSHIINTQIKLK